MFGIGDALCALAVALAIAVAVATFHWKEVECARAGLEQRKIDGNVLWVKP